MLRCFKAVETVGSDGPGSGRFSQEEEGGYDCPAGDEGRPTRVFAYLSPEEGGGGQLPYCDGYLYCP